MRKVMLAVAVVGAAAIATSGWAGGTAMATSGPSSEPVTAQFTLTQRSQSGTECAGVDGTYFQGTQILKGKIKGSDPRLSGSLRAVDTTLQNEDNGWSQDTGTFTIKDAAGTLEAKGTYVLDGAQGLSHGTLTGTLADGSGLYGVMSIVADPNTGALTGEFGEDPGTVTWDMAMIQTGSC